MADSPVPALDGFRELKLKGSTGVWETFDGYTAHDWQKYKLRAKWIVGIPGGVGKLFKGFLARQVRAYNLAHDKANAALTTFFRYHAAAANHRGLQLFEVEHRDHHPRGLETTDALRSVDRGAAGHWPRRGLVRRGTTRGP